ncbi:hypothetical protein AAWM_09589 [Aspergillus awamori]|uniref:Uncharacterized protein n=1 Tax=Aspergillus awamori TaxID=105351 RepID=A0A401L583_ASPAW|nr:hypothetical protein AAWM_09589 [Aspergillus awamori]
MHDISSSACLGPVLPRFLNCDHYHLLLPICLCQLVQVDPSQSSPGIRPGFPLASSPAPTAPPFNSSADASVAFVYFHSAFWPRSTNLILTGPTVLSVSISSDILTAFAILILALLTLPAAVAAAAPSAPTSTLFAIGGPLSM